jgi:hypothetical protein
VPKGCQNRRLNFGARAATFGAGSMKFHLPFLTLGLLIQLSAAEVPKIFAGLLEQDIPVKGQIGMVIPPPEIDKLVAKVEASARKDSKWFREFSGQAKPGVPLPYDERLGLTKDEYAEYLVLWNKREFKSKENVMLFLRQSADGIWSITSTGGASPISTLRYNAKDDAFRSPNGELKRIADIQADPASVLGEWSGNEWKFEEETSLDKTKENVAIGRFADGNFGLIVYRVQVLSTEGSRLLDTSLVIRFALGKAGQIKNPKAAPAKAAPVKVGPAKKEAPAKKAAAKKAPAQAARSTPPA